MAGSAAEHYDWAVARADVYLDMGDAAQAYASFGQDIAKHPGTKHMSKIMTLGMFEAANGDVVGMRRFIHGFARPRNDE